METDPGVKARPGKYLTFNVGEAVFGLPIAHVGQVLGRVSITPVPSAPAFFRGVVQFRRHALPVFDLRIQLGTADAGPASNVIVAQVQVDSAWVVVGLVVDGVHTVEEFGAREISEAPEFSGGQSPVVGVAQRAGRGMVLLLDPARLLSGKEAREAMRAGAGENGSGRSPEPAAGKLTCAAPGSRNAGEDVTSR